MFLFSTVGHTQQAEPIAPPPQDNPFALEQQIYEVALVRGAFRQYWDGRGINPLAIERALKDPDVRRTAWGISDEQWKQIDDYVSNVSIEGRNASAQMMAQMGTLSVEETTKGIQDIEEHGERVGALILDAIGDAFDNTLTAEQKQKIMESLLANMGEIPIVSPGMFEVLNLTNAQKQQMERIKKELEPEFEKNLETNLGYLAKGHTIIMQKGNNDTEAKKIYEEIQSQGKAFSEKFRIKLFDVLTDEQWARLQRLIDDPPEHAKVLRKKLKELSDEDKKAEKPGDWAPGPNSWKPGDPIPERYRQERNTRGNFPRPKQPSP